MEPSLPDIFKNLSHLSFCQLAHLLNNLLDTLVGVQISHCNSIRARIPRAYPP